MKKYRIAAVILFACLMLVSPLLASALQKPAKTESLTGKVSEVNIDAQTIVVIWKNKGMIFEAASAKLKGYETIRGIKPGDKVMVTYEMKEGRAQAKVITKRKGATKTSRGRFFSFGRT